jgi:hypothetical protein
MQSAEWRNRRQGFFLILLIRLDTGVRDSFDRQFVIRYAPPRLSTSSPLSAHQSKTTR